MKIHEFLNEAISSQVFHYTNIRSALDILLAGEFKLSSSLGSIEATYMPPGYHYFLSTTRTLTGGYHSTIGDSAVMFNLDGNFYNRITKGKAVDYWQDRGKGVDYASRPSEAEDRIFSRTNTLPLGGITSIHVYVRPMDEKERKNWGEGTPGLARNLLLAAKIRKIPAFLYEDKKLWKSQSPKGRVGITPREVLKGPSPLRRRTSAHPGYLMPWIELMYAKNNNQLSKKADQIRYNLAYDYDRADAARGLSVDLSNARKPSSGIDYEHVKKIISFMRKNKLKSTTDFVEFLARQWKARAPN